MDLSKGIGPGLEQWGDGWGESEAAERDRRDGGPGQSGFPASPDKMLLGLLISHPGLAWCCAPHESTGGSPISPDRHQPALSLLPGRR